MSAPVPGGPEVLRVLSVLDREAGKSDGMAEAFLRSGFVTRAAAHAREVAAFRLAREAFLERCGVAPTKALAGADAP